MYKRGLEAQNEALRDLLTKVHSTLGDCLALMTNEDEDEDFDVDDDEEDDEDEDE